VTITKAQLIEAIEASTRTMKVCAPSTCYYARDNDWTNEEITFVDPAKLVEAINAIEEA
jgi:hypothetical protein